MTTQYAIEIENLTKSYSGGVEALKGISLTVKSGDFYGLLGPNGAGKSTTIGVMCGLVNKTSGQVKVAGFDIDQHRTQAKLSLGVVPQEFNFNIFESCWQIVINQAGYYGVTPKQAEKRAHELFEQLGLTDKKYRPAGQLSGGMKRRLMIARALVHQPQILILDEPTAGVDISLRRSMWTFLEALNAQGVTIILTTHYLEEAESLCKNIAIIDQGKLIQNTSKENLLSQLQSETLILYVASALAQIPEISNYVFRLPEPSTLEVDLFEGQTLTQVVTALKDHHIDVIRVKNKSNRLEELFVRLVEKETKQ
jgi:ABC-2 type transport system ATP-binding protein